MLSDPNVGESSQGAGGCSGAADDNCIHPSIKVIIDKQNDIIADLSAKVSFHLSYLGLQDMPDAATSQHHSLGGGHSLLFTAVCWRRFLVRILRLNVHLHGHCINHIDQAWIYRPTGGAVFIGGWQRVIYNFDCVLVKAKQYAKQRNLRGCSHRR